MDSDFLELVSTEADCWGPRLQRRFADVVAFSRRPGTSPLVTNAHRRRQSIERGFVNNKAQREEIIVSRRDDALSPPIALRHSPLTGGACYQKRRDAGGNRLHRVV